MIRHAWIGAHADVTQKRQCVLAGVSRTTVYVRRKPVVFVESDEVLKRLIDEEYTRHPFYGSRKMVVYLGALRTLGQPQAGAAPHALHVAGWDGSWAEHERGAPAAQGVPLSPAWRARGAGQSGLEHGHHLRASGARLCLLGGCDRLVLPAGAQLANQQQHGGGVLRRLPGRRLA